MSRSIFATTIAIAFFSALTPANAASCYDLWLERNQIYDEAGKCFETQLAQEVFDNSDCRTVNPKLTRSEQSRVFEIKAIEEAKHCKVNN